MATVIVVRPSIPKDLEPRSQRWSCERLAEGITKEFADLVDFVQVQEEASP